MIFNPYPYQQFCIDNIIYNHAVGLFLDMGLGKTVITLSAVHDLRYNRWEVMKPLIIAPKRWPKQPGPRKRKNGIILT